MVLFICVGVGFECCVWGAVFDLTWAEEVERSNRQRSECQAEIT